MSLITQRSNLRNLKYSETGAVRAPAIVKGFNDRKRGIGLISGLGLQVSKRADDVVRITKTLTRPEGIRFLANQALLNQNQAISALTTGRPVDKGRVVRGAARILGIPATAIAQSAVSGTGLRFIQGGTPINGGYLSPDPGFKGMISNLNPFGSGDSQISKSSQALRGEVINDSFVRSRYGIPEESNEPRKGGTGLISKAKERANIGISIRPKKTDASDSNSVTYVPFKAQTPLSSKFFLPRVGDTKGIKSNSAREQDRINAFPVMEFRSEEIPSEIDSLQLIPFRFFVFPGNGTPELLFFRAYLETLGDNYSGTWSPTNYIGRADPVYTYDSFNRSLSFSFKVATHSRWDLKPLYDKLNRLVSTTAPRYDANGFFKQGVFVKATIGDYVNKIPGFFNSIDLNWEINFPWETEGEGRRVPHILNVNCSFQPIHDFNPQYGEGFNFIGPVSETEAIDRPLPPPKPKVEVKAPNDEIIEDIDLGILDPIPPLPPLDSTDDSFEDIRDFQFDAINSLPPGNFA